MCRVKGILDQSRLSVEMIKNFAESGARVGETYCVFTASMNILLIVFSHRIITSVPLSKSAMSTSACTLVRNLLGMK